MKYLYPSSVSQGTQGLQLQQLIKINVTYSYIYVLIQLKHWVDMKAILQKEV